MPNFQRNLDVRGLFVKEFVPMRACRERPILMIHGGGMDGGPMRSGSHSLQPGDGPVMPCHYAIIPIPIRCLTKNSLS